MQDISSNSENRRYIKSSSFIMALIYTVLCGLASLSLGFFINYFAKGHFVQSTEAVLDSEYRYIQLVYPTQSKYNGPLHVFFDENNTLPKSIAKDLAQDLSKLTEGIIVFDKSSNNKTYAAKIYTLKDGKKVLIGTDITRMSKDFKFMQYMGIASIGFVMLVVFFSYIISVFVVSGTNKIARTAHEIMKTGDLSRRLDVGSRWDDLSNMAAVLNMLLERIEELMHGVRQVSDNIAHDLRTPLTKMQGKIEALPDGEEKTHLLMEVEQLLITFNALLRISRIESEKQRSQFCATELNQVLDDVIEFYQPLAEEKNISLSDDINEVTIKGDRNLLFQAYANILDNAIKFTPENGEIRISLTKTSNEIHVIVSDNGPGIDESEKEKIFDRFYRGDKSRSSTGTGLGLSMVSAIIDLHDGQIEAKNTNPGLTIITTL